MASDLDELTVMNDQLAALAEAGVPLDVGLGRTANHMANSLDRVSDAVIRRMEQGESLTESLEGDEQTVPTLYRCMVQLGLRAGTLCTALDGSNRLAATVEQSGRAVRSAFFYPLVLCVLVYVGMIGFCLGFVPVLVNLYHSLRIPWGIGLQTLYFLRDTLPYWASIPPVAVLFYLIWRWRDYWQSAPAPTRPARLVRLIPGVGQTLYQQRAANFAESLATLLEREVPLEEGLRLAACASGDAQLSEGARSLVAAMRQWQLPAYDSPTARWFPPFLRWALWHAEETAGRSSALRIAAAIYREAAERRTERLRVLAPITVCVFIGGGVTLLYGLALFVPVIEMLKALAFCGA